MGLPRPLVPPPTSTGYSCAGGVGRLEVGGARLLFALRPPPFPMGGDPGAGGSEPASGEGASPRAIQERSGWLALPQAGLRALKKGPGTAARPPFSVFSGRLPKLP